MQEYENESATADELIITEQVVEIEPDEDGGDFEYVTDPRKRQTQLNEELIEEINGYLKRGGVDITICRIIGVHPQTFIRWKNYGRRVLQGDKTLNPIYGIFYRDYQMHRGKRELHWLDLVGDDAKWLLKHHPDTREQYAEMRYSRQELTGTLTAGESAERQKDLDKALDESLSTAKRQLLSPVSDDREEVPSEHTEAEEMGD